MPDRVTGDRTISRFALVIFGALLMLIMIFRPQGLIAEPAARAPRAQGTARRRCVAVTAEATVDVEPSPERGRPTRPLEVDERHAALRRRRGRCNEVNFTSARARSSA